jgi:thioredoxin 1
MEPKFASVAVFRIDFNLSNPVLRQWKVYQQATLIAFKGKSERTRLVYSADPEAIRKIFEESL